MFSTIVSRLFKVLLSLDKFTNVKRVLWRLYRGVIIAVQERSKSLLTYLSPGIKLMKLFRRSLMILRLVFKSCRPRYMLKLRIASPNKSWKLGLRLCSISREVKLLLMTFLTPCVSIMKVIRMMLFLLTIWEVTTMRSSPLRMMLQDDGQA